ncbi:MAG TPA: hypothetical protein VGW74_14195, partial [Propionibacteriaceae bacterium]|nr:hypothetical protein [Propionibacteriaceae bacterium]
MAWLPQTSNFPVGVPDGGGPADDALQLLDPTRPYKPLDVGEAGVSASVDAYGRLVAVSQGHPEHGTVTLHAHPPLPQS